MSRPVNQGDPLILPPPAKWNEVFYGKTPTELGDPRGQRTQLPNNGLIVKVKNNSGAGIGAGDALEVQAKIVTTLRRDRLWFAGDTPAVPSLNLWGVAVRPIPSNKIGEVQLSGVCLAPVTINDAQHCFADVADGTETLSSAWHGVRILYKPSGTGVLTCALLLGSYTDGPWKGVVSEVDGIDAGATGEVTVWWEGAETTTPDTVQAKYAWMAGAGNAAEGAECLFRWVRDEGIYEITEIEC